MKKPIRLRPSLSKLHRKVSIEVLEARIAPASVINFNGSGAIVVDLAAHTITDSAAPGSPVTYTGADIINLTAGASLKVQGTAGSDALTYTPGGANDGSLSVDGVGLTINFTGVTGAFTIDPLGGNDLITVKGSAGNDAITATGGATPTLQVGASKTLTLAGANTEAVVINALDGNDTLTVDSTAGAFAVPITYRGGNGFDTLVLKGGTATSSAYTLGPTSDAGINTMVIGGITQTVSYAEIEPVQDSVAAGTLTVNGTNANNSINYVQGPGGGIFIGNTGLISVDGNETIEFNNKTNVVINGLAGDDTINLHYNNTSNPAGLTGTITVNGGDPIGNDTLIVNGISGALDNLRYLPTAVGAGTVINDSQPQPNVLFTGIEHLTAAVQQAESDGVRVDGTTGNDAIEFYPGTTSDSSTFIGTMDQNNATGAGPFTMTPMTYTGASPAGNDTDVNFFNPGGTDTFVFNGTDKDDTLSVGTGEAGGTEFRDTVNGIIVSRIELFNVAGATVRGLAGNDIINVSTPAGPAAVTLRVEGGGSIGSFDTLNYNAPGGAATTVDFAAATITSPGANSLTFSGFSKINETSSGGGSSLKINGTAGDDLFAYTPSGATAGIVSLAGNNPVLAFTGVGSTFTIDPLGGNDVITVNGSSANDAIKAIAGGTPTVQVGSSKTLSLTAANTESLVINGLDGNDTLTVDSTAAAFAAPITFDGGAGLDTLALKGTADSSSYTFGPSADAGVSTMVIGAATQTVVFKGVEPIQDSVVADTLTVNGTNANNSINYTQGPGGGVFSGNTGLLSVDGFATVEFNNKTNVVLNGLAGDDTISVNNPSEPAGLTGTISVNGGESTDSDTLIMNAVNRNLILAPTSQGAGTVSYFGGGLPSSPFTGIESLTLVGTLTNPIGIDGTTGDDQFIYTPGVTPDTGTIVGTMNMGGIPFALVPVTLVGIQQSGTLVINAFGQQGGNDTFVFRGTAADNNVSLTAGGVFGGITLADTVNGSLLANLNPNNMQSVTVEGHGAHDVFTHSGSVPIAVTYAGGPGDSLTFNGSGAPTVVDLAAKTATDGAGTVSFGSLSVLNVDAGSSTLTIHGTTLPDSFTYSPTNVSAGTLTAAGLNPTINVTNVSTAAGAFTITPGSAGDTVTVNGTTGSDTITAASSATNTTVQVNALLAVTLPNANTGSLTVAGGFGDDNLIVDSTNGPVLIAINYDGGAGSNALTLTGGTATSDTYSPGPIPGAGTSTLVFAGGTEVVHFQNLAPVYDSVAADTLTVNGTNANNSMSFTQGSAGGSFTGNTGLVTVDGFETIEFNNKTSLVINGMAGDDSINLSDSSTPAGLTGITVNGGGPAGNDTLTLFGTAGADQFTFVGTDAMSGTLTLVGSVPVSYTGTKHAVLDGQGGDDSFLVASATGRVELNGGDGSDTVNFSGSASAITFNLDALGVDQHVNATGEIVSLGDVVENFTGSAFNDVIFVKVQSFARSIDGGSPSVFPGVPGSPIPPGDRLTVDADHQFATIVKVNNAGTVSTRGYGTISFTDVESADVVNSSSSGGFTGDGSGAFAATVLYKVGGNPVQTVVGDVNGDGFDDIVTANRNTHSVSVLLSDGDGTFAPVVTYKTGKIAPLAIALGNVDDNLNVPGGDNSLDIVLVQNGGAKAAVMLNDGAGHFGTPTTFRTVAALPGSVKLADFNNDGLLDIATLHKASGNVSILLNTGGGVAGIASFGPATTLKTRSIASDFAIANFDGDAGGNLDIAVVGTTGFLRVLTGNGTGAFTLQTTKYDIGKHPSVIALADFNNDGKLDIAVNHTVQHFVSVLLGRGNLGGDLFQPSLQTSFAFADFHTARSMTAADFDGDGNVDLAFSSDSNTVLHIGLGLGSGLFKRPLNLLVTTPVVGPTVGVTGLLTGDFNGDGALDIVVSNNATNNVGVIFRTPTV